MRERKLRQTGRLPRSSQVVCIQEAHTRAEDPETLAHMELVGVERVWNHGAVLGAGGLLTSIVCVARRMGVSARFPSQYAAAMRMVAKIDRAFTSLPSWALYRVVVRAWIQRCYVGAACRIIGRWGCKCRCATRSRRLSGPSRATSPRLVSEVLCGGPSSSGSAQGGAFRTRCPFRGWRLAVRRESCRTGARARRAEST